MLCLARVMTEMPTVTVSRSPVLVNEGEMAELRCEADGIPPPRTSWQRDGILVSDCAVIGTRLLSRLSELAWFSKVLKENFENCWSRS